MSRGDGRGEYRSGCGFGLRLATAHFCEGFLVIGFGAKAFEGAISFHLIDVVEALLRGRLQGS